MILPERTGGSVPTRRILELVVITNVLFWPARKTVLFWGRKQLSARVPGSLLHTAGEVIVTIL
jgi:hypothetical protein